MLRIALIVTLLLPMTGSLPAVASRAAVISPAEALSKIESSVLEDLASDGQTDFIVWLPGKADLSSAYRMKAKEERRRFVLEALRETAERSQRGLRQLLDAQGIDYRAFYIADKLLVHGGNRTELLNIAARPDVSRITANHTLQLDEPPVSSWMAAQGTGVEPNVAFIRADQAWTTGSDGTGTVLAANDTGLDVTHPAIAPHYRGCLDPPDCTLYDHNYNWWDATGMYPAAPWDGHGHGTHVTGTMVGDDGGDNQIGVAPGAQTIHCKNMNDSGTGYDATVIECLEWDLAPWDLSGANPRPDLAPDAVNNSWGYSGGAQDQFRDEIQALQAAGILVEVSAGNEGPACGSLNSPGDYAEVLTAGSVSHAAAFPGTLSRSSSRGPSRLDPSPPSYLPDIVAPGENIRSSVPGYGYASLSGTSMASPHVTALAGLLWSACPSLQGDIDATVDIILRTAAPLVGQSGSGCGGDYQTGPNNDWGSGTIDALASVQLAQALCSGMGQLSGYVREDAKPARPVEGATVTAAWQGGHEWHDVTDASGYYSMTVPSGTYTVSVELFGYLAQEIAGVEVTEDGVTEQDLVLTRSPEHRLEGHVTEAGSGRPLSATVQVLDAPLLPVWTDPSTGFYSMAVPEGTYTFYVTAQRHRAEQRQVAVDRDRTEDYALASAPCILVVDDDNNIPDVRPYFVAALEALGYSYEVFDVGGGSGNGPPLVALQEHTIVLWFSGDKYVHAAGPNAIDEANLAAYLDGGGKLFLSSQDYLWDAGLTPFGVTYLGIGSYSNDAGDASVMQGVAGDPVGGGLGPYMLTYPDGFSDYGDIVDPAGVASTAFRSADAAGNSLDLDVHGGDWQTVFFGTSWVPVYYHDAASGMAVMKRIVEWFGGCENVAAPGAMHVGDLDGALVRANTSFWWASVTVTVHDADHNPLPDARVSGTWSRDPDHPRSCTSDASGQCTMLSPKVSIAEEDVRFVVDAITDVAHGYDPDANHDPDGDSDGTEIPVYRLGPGNQPPVAAFTYTCTGLSCGLDASASHDPDGTIGYYAWDLGDETFDNGVAVSHTYAVSATYAVTLTVADEHGATDDDTQYLQVEVRGHKVYTPIVLSRSRQLPAPALEPR